MTQRAPATSPADRGAFGARPQPVAWAVESRLRGDRPLGQRTPRGGGRAPCGEVGDRCDSRPLLHAALRAEVSNGAAQRTAPSPAS